MISSLLNVAYLMPIVVRAFFKPLPGHAPGTPVKIAEAPIACVVPLCITAFGCLVLFFAAEPIVELAQSMGLKPETATALSVEPSGGGGGHGR